MSFIIGFMDSTYVPKMLIVSNFKKDQDKQTPNLALANDLKLQRYIKSIIIDNLSR